MRTNRQAEERLRELAAGKKAVLVLEMNAGQMLLDVKAIVEGRAPVHFYGRMGGTVPFPDEILGEIRRMAQGGIPLDGDPRHRWAARHKAFLQGGLK